MSDASQAGWGPQPGEAFSLNLPAGTITEVMTPENRLIFVGRVEKVQRGGVFIHEVNGDELPMVLVNKQLKLRFYLDEGNIVLHGKVCGSTIRMWKVDRLQSTFTQEQRAFFRQSIGIDITARCGKYSPKSGEPEVMFPCQVLDVSAGGMFISCKEVFIEGDRLVISQVVFTESESPFTFLCQVRRASEWKKGVTRYGCQFISLPPKVQDRLLRAIFTVQREEIRRRKARSLL